MTDQEIKEAYDNIHIPPALLGKVEDAMNTNNFKRKKIIKIAVAAIAVFAICLLASNGICYAATGNSLLRKITMYVNGREICLNGVEYGEPTSIYTYTTEDTVDDSNVDCVIEFNESLNFQVKKEGESVYLLSEDGKKKIDITDDFTGKKANGDFNWNDMTYHYEVTRNGEKYSLSLNARKK